MKISSDEDNSNLVTLELETDSGYHTFKAGLTDRKQWIKDPETCELSNFIRDNRKFAQIAVGYKDSWVRVK